MSTLKIAIDRLKLNVTGDDTPAAVFSQAAMIAIILNVSADGTAVTRPLLRDVTGLSNFGVLSIVNGLIRRLVVEEALQDNPDGGHARLVYSLMPTLEHAGMTSNSKLEWRNGDLRHDANMMAILACVLDQLYLGRRSDETKTLLLKQLATAVHLLYLAEEGEELSRKALVELTELTPAALSVHLTVLCEKGIFVTSAARDRTERGRPNLRYAVSDKFLAWAKKRTHKMVIRPRLSAGQVPPLQ